MAELADKLRDKTLTVGEALDLATKDAPESRVKNINTFANKLKKLGIEADAPFTSIGEAANLELLAKEKGQPFAALTTVQNAINGAAAAQDIEPPFPDYSAKAQSAGLIEGKQKRGSLAFKGVPEAKFSMPAIMNSIKNIDDPNTRAAVAFNALIPIRVGGENGLTSLTFDDIDLENGVILEAGSGNKFRPEIVLPPVARSILEDQAREAREQGRSRIFDTTREKMTKAINAPGGMRDTFAEFERRMGRKLAGIKDLRKIVPSILAYELGYTSLVSKILGHESASAIMGEMAKMTSDFYTSPVFKIDEVEPETVALRAVENLFADTANMGDLRELPIEMNVSATRITGSNEKIPVVPQGQDLLDGSTPVPSTPEDDNVLELREQQRISEIEAKTARADADKEIAETDKQKAIAERGPISEEVTRIQVQESETRNEVRRELNEQKAEQERLAAQEARSQKNAGTQAEDPEVVAKRAEANRTYASKIAEYLKKSKVIPYIGFVGAGIAAQQKGAAAQEAFEEGDYVTAAKRGAQAVEELVSPLPVTTGDLEQMGRSPEQTELVKMAQRSRLESMQRRSERVRSQRNKQNELDDQMNNLIPQP